VNLANVNTIAIGFGDRNNPQPGGSGKMYFDDIFRAGQASKHSPFGKLRAGLPAMAKHHPKNWGQKNPSSKSVKK